MKLPLVILPAPPIDWACDGRRYVNPGELETLVMLYRRIKPRVCIEIGVNEGRTADVLMRNVPTIDRYIGVDVPSGYKFAKQVQRNEVPKKPGYLAQHDGRFQLIVKPRGSFDLTYVDLPPCDAVFIDGDHGADAVRHDYALALRLVRPGGIIAFHDYHDQGTVDVRDVLDAEFARGAPLVHVANTWIAYQEVRG